MQLHIYNFLKLQFSRKQIFYLTLFLIIMILTILALNNVFSKSNYIPTWESAERITPTPLLKNILSKKETRSFDISSIKVMQIPSQGTGNLYIFDYGSPQFCGAFGCLYSVYNDSGELLLEFIAHSQLPKSQKLIKVGETINQDFPCLKITQNSNIDGLLSQTKFCYQKGKYVRLNQNLVSGGKND